MIYLAVQIDLSDPYVDIILAASILVLSFLYNIIADKTNIPSVLLLILTGMGINAGLAEIGVLEELRLMPILELLGIVGLIMIVLEAALDLELTKETLPTIGQTFLVALLCLVGSSFLIAWLIQLFYPEPFLQCLIYATPLGVMSSAIIIPSVAGLPIKHREFMIYEGAFSDILGIMMFYFLTSWNEQGGVEASASFGINFLLTIVVSIVASYALIYLFKDIKGHIRLFLLIAVLLMLYSTGKLLHLSPLLIILVFGLMLANHQTFFGIFKNFFADEDPIEDIEKEFHLITLETAFVVRTFFFVVFGMTIDISSLFNLNTLLISTSILVGIYVVRYIFLRIFTPSHVFPELWIAPRGLITILLFFAIPATLMIDNFDSGILLYVIIISSVIMSLSLIVKGRDKEVQEEEQETATGRPRPGFEEA